MSYQKYINSEFSSLTLAEVLREPVSVLIGVSEDVKQALSKLRIHNVFDLGMSEIFDNAARILHNSEEPNSVFRKFGRVPAAMVDKNTMMETEVTELPYEAIEVLIGIGPNNGPDLQTHLSVSTIRDLAMWPPYLAAKALVLEEYDPEVVPEGDPDAPAELVPKSGDFGTERFLFSSLAMFPGNFQSKPMPLNNTLFDIAATPKIGFDTVRFGALLTYSQEWFPMRVAKGQLLHSLPLAPGESTRLAVITWSNKSSATTRETLSETEKLSNTNHRARAVTEIANTVANEFQSGSSQTASKSSTASLGRIKGIAAPLGLGVLTSGASGSRTAAATHTVSSGTRRISTHLSQNILDSTQQVASSVRGQRAAVISEVSQSQSEHLSTRTVTNYNHMHALTVQYYEVVQVNEVRVRLDDYERCIFLPIELVDFTDERNIIKYLPILCSVALDPHIQTLLESIAESGGKYTLQFDRKFRRLPTIRKPDGGFVDCGDLGEDITFPQDLMDPFGYMEPEIRSQIEELLSIRRQFCTQYDALDHDNFIEFRRYSRTLGLNYELQLNNIMWHQPDPALIKHVEIELEHGQRLVLNESAEQNAKPDIVNQAFDSGQALSFGRIRAIRIFTNPTFGRDRSSFEKRYGHFELAVKLNGESRWLDCSIYTDKPGSSYDGDVLLRLRTPDGLAEIGQILMENQLYYSQQIWRRQNPQTLIMQLAPFTLKLGEKTINLIDHITPVPVKIVGNFAVYRFNYEDDSQWRKWVEENVDLSDVHTDQVAVPTGGVFAEAILGRFNSAEKIDNTRFFNWQDSPPDEPPSIAPLKAGQRTDTAGAPDLPEFDPSVVRIQSPQALPDPGGLSAALTAIVTADIFRNMSGAAATASAGEGAAAAASELSVDALAKAGSAFANTLSTLSNTFGTLASDKGLKSISSLGALFNEKKKSEAKASKADISSDASDILNDAMLGTYLEDALGGEQAILAGYDPADAGSSGSGPATIESVFREYPGLDPNIEEPKARSCCALFPGGVLSSFTTEYLDPASIADHNYGEYGLCPGDSVGQVYTARGGFVDLGHVRDLADMTRYLSVQAILRQKAGGDLILKESEGGIHKVVFKPAPSQFPNIKLACLVGARAAYEFAIWHEIVTWFTYQRYSSFSPEDNYSNLLGTFVGGAATALPGQAYNQAVDRILTKEALPSLDAQSADVAHGAIKAVTGLWFEDFNDLTGPLLGSALFSPDGTTVLRRRHVQPSPKVIPWLVSDLHGKSFHVPDPVAGPGETRTIDFELADPKPRPLPLYVPSEAPGGLNLEDFFRVEIKVDTDVVPQSVLPDQRSNISSQDLPGIVEEIRLDILTEFPHGDLPIDP